MKGYMVATIVLLMGCDALADIVQAKYCVRVVVLP